MKPCPLCGTRALPRADGSCPACNGQGAPKVEPEAFKASASSPMNSPTLLVAVVLGVTFAGFWSNRTASGGVDMMTIVVTLGTVLGAVAGVVTVRAIAARVNR